MVYLLRLRLDDLLKFYWPPLSASLPYADLVLPCRIRSRISALNFTWKHFLPFLRFTEHDRSLVRVRYRLYCFAECGPASAATVPTHARYGMLPALSSGFVQSAIFQTPYFFPGALALRMSVIAASRLWVLFCGTAQGVIPGSTSWAIVPPQACRS